MVNAESLPGVEVELDELLSFLQEKKITVANEARASDLVSIVKVAFMELSFTILV